MGIKILRTLPTPSQLKLSLPLDENLIKKKIKFDKEIADIITGNSNKFLVIVGPCSADNEDAVSDYMNRLAKLNEKIKDKIFVVPRIYTHKPRSFTNDYKGILHTPDPNKENNIYEGLISMRKLHLRIIKETGMFGADEMLYPSTIAYIDDLISYIAIGARSVENQEHRLVSSTFDVPVGIKNPTNGNIDIMLNAIVASKESQQLIYQGNEVLSEGNNLSHAVLRGFVSSEGVHIPNYHCQNIRELFELYKKRNISNPALIIDVNHSNSLKNHRQQISIAKEIVYNKINNEDINSFIKGIMIESYIKEGAQGVNDGVYGKSITDPCLSFEDTKELLLYIYNEL